MNQTRTTGRKRKPSRGNPPSKNLCRQAVATGVFLLLAHFSQTVAAANYTLTTLAENLDYPWCVADLPNGDLLITERTGQLKRLSQAGELVEISGVPAVYFAGQGGLFDVLVDSDFATNQRIFLSFANGNKDANATRVVSAKLIDDALEDLQVLFTASPEKDTPQHYGGKLTLLPDSTLLITTGDGFDYREQAQNTNSNLGKTIRINRDGSLPADNPFSDGGGHPAVWTYGHRNPQGLAVDPANGAVYLHEHGPKGGDEINVLAPGSNYGWPATTYGDDYSGAKVSPFTERPGIQSPLKVWVPSIAPSGLTVYRGEQFPEWQGSLFVGALVDQEVRRVSFADDGLKEEAVFPEIAARIRDIRTAPDGSLLIVTDGSPGTLYRISRSAD
jgi:glucose/arabinose dehydrogenase